jgi:hypothetical protein
MYLYPSSCPGPKIGHNISEEDTVLVYWGHSLHPNTSLLDFGLLGNIFVYKQKQTDIVVLYEIYQESLVDDVTQGPLVKLVKVNMLK